MRRKTEPSNGFTLIELLVVIAIISLLVSILMPSLQTAKQLATSTDCMSRLRNTGMAIVFYAEDYDGLAPPWRGIVYVDTEKRWTWYLRQYIEDISNISCPGWVQDDDPWFGMAQSYGMNRGSNDKAWRGVDRYNVLAEPGYWDGPLLKFVVIGPPAEFPMIGDSRNWSYNGQTWDFTYPAGSWAHVHPRHLERANLWCADGHVDSADIDALMDLYKFEYYGHWED